jgi:hypothetical protein
MLEAIININKQAVVARAQEQAQQRTATTMDEVGSSSNNPLENDCAGFPDTDALEAGIQRGVRQHTAGLHNVRQPNARL